MTVSVTSHALSSWQVPSLIFKFWSTSHTIPVHPTSNLRPEMDSAAFYTYKIKFPDLKMVSFMSYTHNIGSPIDGTNPHDGPHWPIPHWPDPPQPGPRDSPTPPQPKNNLISINYYNLWLYPLNVVGGLIWIGKKIIKKFYVTCHGL